MQMVYYNHLKYWQTLFYICIGTPSFMQGHCFLKYHVGTEESYHARLPLSIHTPDKIVATSHSSYSIKSKQTRYKQNFEFEKGSSDRNKK